MIYGTKPFKTFGTVNGNEISEGDEIQFEDIENTTVKGFLVKAMAKAIEIVETESSTNTIKYPLKNIKENTMKKIG